MQPKLLWLDCISSTHEPSLRARAEEFFDVTICANLVDASRMILEGAPNVLCFDFDYPLESHLREMQSIKRTHVGLPVLMLTVEHSEALAVWSFRARVWNYLVKPVPSQEWRANLRSLAQVSVLGARQRRTLRLPGPALSEFASGSRTDDSYGAILPAIEHIERNFHARINASEMARLCGMSPFRFSREFHSAIGSTFQDHVLRFRVAEACRIMRQRPDMAVGDVSFSVGFNDSSYFARVFKRYMNVRPTEYTRAQPAAAPAAPMQTPSAAAHSVHEDSAPYTRRASDRRRATQVTFEEIQPDEVARLMRTRRAVLGRS